MWGDAAVLFHLLACAGNHQRDGFQAALGDALLILAWPSPFETRGSQAGSEQLVSMAWMSKHQFG